MPRTQTVLLPAAFGVSKCLLVFDGDVLLAVFGQLSDAMFETNSGKWHVEATFTPEVKVGDVYKDLNTAMQRLRQDASHRLVHGRRRWGYYRRSTHWLR